MDASQETASKRQPLRTERGQGITEYLILVALLAIATIGVAKIFGNNLRVLFANINNSMTNAGNSDYSFERIDKDRVQHDLNDLD